jgi:hypothetical protein
MATPGVFKSIKTADKSITPFKVFKSWRYNLSTIDTDLNRLSAIKPDTSNQSGNVITLEAVEQLVDSSSYLINTTDNKPTGVIYYSLDHLYYKRSLEPSNTFGYSSTSVSKLYDKASIISIPQQIFGESLRPSSIVFNYTASAMSASLYDNNGSLIDRNLPTPVTNVLNVSFNDTTYESNWLNSDYYNTDKYTGNNIAFTSSFIGYGNSLKLQNNSYLLINDSAKYNYQPDEEFAISLWANISNITASVADGDYVYLVSKRTTSYQTTLSNTGVNVTSLSSKSSDKYSYDIRYNLITSELECRRSDGINTAVLKYTILPNTNYHIVFQKTDNLLALYVNNVEISSTSDVIYNTANECSIIVGALDVNTASMTGQIFELNIFDFALTNTQINQLYQNPINSNQVGKVIYEHGQIIVSDPRPVYNQLIFSDLLYNKKTNSNETATCTGLVLEFSSTLTLFEHEYICRLNSDEFNFTSNPTIRRNNDLNSSVPKDIATNPNFYPYITTVGLYNDKGQLLAIGKLASAIQKRSNVDTNVVVRFDI